MAMAEGIERLYREPEYFLKLSENAAKRVRCQTSREYTIVKEEKLINGYDLPENSTLSYEDAATINFAMLGVRSKIAAFARETFKDKGPINAELIGTDGYHMLLTGIFGKTRINQPEAVALGEAMKLGKEAVLNYTNGDATLLGQYLGEAVRNLQVVFSGASQYELSQDMVAGSKTVERLLNLFDKKPDILAATGLEEKNLEFMRGYVQMGQLYDNYVNSNVKLIDAAAEGKTLSTQEKTEMLVDAVIFKMVSNELVHEHEQINNSPEYKHLQAEAEAKEAALLSEFEQWKEESGFYDLSRDEQIETQRAYRAQHDMGAFVTMHASTVPADRRVISMLAQPGMLERLRQELQKDPAILELAAQDEICKNNGMLLGEEASVMDLATRLKPALEYSAVTDAQKQAWFESLKNQGGTWLNANVATDEGRLMIAQANADGTKSMVSVASLLDGGLKALENPNQKTIDLLYKNAMDGNIYYYQLGKDMPQRITANGAQAEAQQLEAPVQPTLWQRIANFLTLGRAYADVFNPAPDRDPAAMQGILRSRDGRIATIEVEIAAHEIAKQAVKEEPAKEQPAAENQAEKQVKNKPAPIKRGLEPHDPTNIISFLNRLAYNEENLPANKVIGINGEKMGALVAMAMASSDLSYRTMQNGQEVRIHNDPDVNYEKIVCNHYIQNGRLASELKPFVRTGERTVGKALREAEAGDFSKLGKIIADGLTQNNKMLQAQRKLTDTYTAYATLGDKLLQMMDGNEKLKEAVMNQLGNDPKQINMAKAAKNISDLRLDALDTKNAMESQIDLYVTKVINGKEMTVPVSLRSNEEMALIGQACNIEVLMNFQQFDLATTNYSDPKTVQESIRNLSNSDELTAFRCGTDRKAVLDDPVKMQALFNKAVDSFEKQRNLQQKQPVAEKALDNQIQEAAKQGPMA